MGIESKRGWRIGGALYAVLLGISLLVPALLNRQPILYSDSVGYFHTGYAAFEQLAGRLHSNAHPSAGPSQAAPPLARQDQDGISTARSVYYGLPYVVMFLAGGNWALIAVQGLLTLVSLLLAARRALPVNVWLRWGGLFAIASFSGLSFFADTVMPDLFAGLMLLAAAMLLAYGKAMPGAERCFWLFMVLLACLFHKSHLLILILLILAGGSFLWRTHIKECLQLFAIALLGLAGHFAVDVTIRHLTGRPPLATPFLLARMIGDGTVQKYLEQVCPGRRFVTCHYLDRMPMSENEFLWSRDSQKSVLGTADRETRAAINAESGEIVGKTLLRYPIEQAAATARNIFNQLTSVGVTEFGLVPNEGPNPIGLLHPAVERYRASPLATGGAAPLRAISTIMLAVYVASLAGAGFLLLRTGASPAKNFALILSLGIGTNAAVCGAISGVFDRYQGRVAWLALLALAVLIGKALPAIQIPAVGDRKT